MAQLETNFGTLTGLDIRSYYSNKKQDGAMACERSSIKTPYGFLIPQYEAEDMGRRQVKPLYCYKSGELKSVPLQEQTNLYTSVGVIPAELVTFYASGAIKRAFPLDGKLSGFWTWENEQQLSVSIEIETPVGLIDARFIGIQFYESGAIKSFTLWPNETVVVQTPVGRVSVRTGMSFYENGAIRSFEPADALTVETSIGYLNAYDTNPLGIHGDINSLQFDEHGQVVALNTIDNEIKVIDASNNRYLYKPFLKDALCGHKKKEVVPLRIKFEANVIIFHENEKHRFSLLDCECEITENELAIEAPQTSCA